MNEDREGGRELLMMYRVALIVQIHLQQNRSDLAVKEVQAAKRWAQDSLLVNLAESWVGMRVVCFLPPFEASGWVMLI